MSVMAQPQPLKVNGELPVNCLTADHLQPGSNVGAERALLWVRKTKVMAMSLRSAFRKVWLTLSSIKTGVILIILVVIFSAAGTVILQRPITDPEDIQRAYSPAMLRFLDAVGLTDVFHARWFVTLMILVSLSIIAASVQRFPNAWRYFARPYKSPDQGFRKVLPTQALIAITDEEHGLSAAERAFKHLGLKSERIVRTESFSLFSERN